VDQWLAAEPWSWQRSRPVLAVVGDETMAIIGEKKRERATKIGFILQYIT